MFLTVNITLNEDGNLPSKSIIYSNTWKHVVDLKTKLERGFDPDNINHSTEVLVVHGQLSKVGNIVTHRSSSTHQTRTTEISV